MKQFLLPGKSLNTGPAEHRLMIKAVKAVIQTHFITGTDFRLSLPVNGKNDENDVEAQREITPGNTFYCGYDKLQAELLYIG